MFDELLDDLKQDEGWEPSVYKDSLGYWTIGFGFLVDPEKNGELPIEVGEYWLKYAAERRWNQLRWLHPWIAQQPDDVQRALANMAYQMGAGGVSNFKNMLAALQAGDREKAAAEALDSRWAIQTPNRAKRVTDLIRGDA